jgi:hypothetical protein
VRADIRKALPGKRPLPMILATQCSALSNSKLKYGGYDRGRRRRTGITHSDTASIPTQSKNTKNTKTMNTKHLSSPPRSRSSRGFVAGASHALLFAVLCLGPGKAAAQTGTLLHEWGFDGDGTDVAGGNTATVYGAATFATTGGLFGGGCLICPASLADYASATYFPPPGTADNGTTGTRSYTVSAWVNMGGGNTTRDAMVFAWGQNGGNEHSEQGLTTKNGQVGHGRWDGATWQSSFVGSIPASNWHLLANTVSGNTVSQYIDGVLVGATSITNAPNTGQILMGNLNFAAGYQFGSTRKIDDIAVWSSPLSAGKVAALANVLSVNSGALSDYNAGKMAVLFQVYDDSTSRDVTSTTGTLNWSKFTGGSGTAGQVTYSAGTYQAWFTATDGVQASIPTYTITASAETGGTITPSGSVVVGQGLNQSFTIAANTGYVINQVLVDGNNNDTAVATGSYTFTNLTGDHTIAATFVSTATWTIAVTQGANGTITPDPAIVNNGANQTFTITPNSRYQIADVLVDGGSVGAVSSHTFTNVTADGHTITATFAAIAPLVDVNLTSVTGGDVTSITNGGSLGGNFTVDGTGTAPVVTIVGSKRAIQLNLTGTTLLLNGAAPTPNSVLGLDGSGGAGANPVYTILATVYRPDFVDAPNGCVFASFAPYRYGASFCYGDTPWIANHWMAGVTMAVTNPDFYNTHAPAGSWHTLLFTSDGSSENLYIDGATTPVATTTGPTSFYNEYNNNRYPIRLGGTDMGDGSGLGSLYNGAIGSLQIWSIPTAAADVPAVTAAIAPIAAAHTITASAGTGGTITPLGAVEVNPGAEQAFTITANAGYVLDQVLVDGTNDPAAVLAGGYTFSSVIGDHTIEASFLTTFASWAKSKGLDGTPGKEAGAADDPDKDGLTNLQEFAFNGNPLSGADRGQVHIFTEEVNADTFKELVLTIAVRDTATLFAGSPSPSLAVDGITYTIEGSNDLSSFLTPVNVLTTAVTTALPAAGEGYQYRSFSLQGKVGSPVKGFLRAKVTEP